MFHYGYEVQNRSIFTSPEPRAKQPQFNSKQDDMNVMIIFWIKKKKNSGKQVGLDIVPGPLS